MHSWYIIHEFDDTFSFIKSHFDEEFSSFAINTSNVIILVTISANACVQIRFFCLKIDISQVSHVQITIIDAVIVIKAGL